MSQISGFDWWFRNREYVLRENLESVEATCRIAVARSARLSSQLSQLKGTLEHRLDALSAAFDAYVQLGDIREQLDAFGDTPVIRRDAIAALGLLGDGKPAAPVNDRGTGYWIAAATNAVIARVSGAPDIAAETALASQEPDAAVFLVAAAGALGHGAEVAGSVANLLHSDDGQLTGHQLDLWRAVLRGDFGPDVLKTLMIDWHDHLSSRPAADWWTWATQQGAQASRDTLDWIEDQVRDLGVDHDLDDHGLDDHDASDHDASDHDVSGASASGPAISADQQPTLRDLVLELINAGFGDEKQLLATARALRARIEHPGFSPSAAGQDHLDDAVDVVDLMRSGYLRLQPSPTGSELLMAFAPGLAAAMELQAPRLLTGQPVVVPVRIDGKSVPVTPQGPDQSELAAAIDGAVPWTDPAASKGRLYGLGVATIACIVIALILAVAGVAIWLVVLLLIVAVTTGILTVRTLQAGVRQAERRQAEVADWDASVEAAKQRAAKIDTAQRQAVQKTADQLDRIRALLAQPAPQIPTGQQIPEEYAGLPARQQ